MDGVKIRNNGAIIASLRPSRLRAFASNFLCQRALATNRRPYRSIQYLIKTAKDTQTTAAHSAAIAKSSVSSASLPLSP